MGAQQIKGDHLQMTLQETCWRVYQIYTISEVGQVAGFKLNKNKTNLLVKNMTEQNKNELQVATQLIIEGKGEGMANSQEYKYF